MGEPLDNWANVEKAVRIMNAPEGMGIAARRLTVSTAGFVDAFKRLEALDLQINLSISLHAVTDRLRDRLMPINRRFPLEELVERGRILHPRGRPDDHPRIHRHPRHQRFARRRRRPGRRRPAGSGPRST
ncbi:MAG: hypothetical protein M0C28_40485 [Candidatus Moduliflexus flocculans]|nr:hypothetical protein [Candidatus Moduliflexus flocculans]